MFAKTKLDTYYFTTQGFYIYHIPVKVPYKMIYPLADKAGLKKKQDFGPIIEHSSLLGFGWIGVEVEKPKESRDDVRHVAGEFEVYEHRGPYRTLGQAYKKIMSERPRLKEHYNLYLDDPEKTAPANCRTQIFFR